MPAHQRSCLDGGRSAEQQVEWPEPPVSGQREQLGPGASVSLDRLEPGHGLVRAGDRRHALAVDHPGPEGPDAAVVAGGDPPGICVQFLHRSDGYRAAAVAKQPHMRGGPVVSWVGDDTRLDRCHGRRRSAACPSRTARAPGPSRRCPRWARPAGARCRRSPHSSSSPRPPLPSPRPPQSLFGPQRCRCCSSVGRWVHRCRSPAGSRFLRSSQRRVSECRSTPRAARSYRRTPSSRCRRRRAPTTWRRRRSRRCPTGHRPRPASRRTLLPAIRRAGPRAPEFRSGIHRRCPTPAPAPAAPHVRKG